jgi:hypothetical protein
MKNGWLVNGVFLVALLFLGGCADSRGTAKIGNQDVKLIVRPEQSLGAWATPALEAGKVVSFENPMSDSQVGGEMYPGRIMSSGLVVNPQKEVFFAQSIWAGIYSTGKFKSCVMVDDAKLSQMKGAKFLPLSSQANVYWDDKGSPVPIEPGCLGEEKCRDELVMKNGISIEERHLVIGFDKMVKSWNRYEANGVEIYSPLNEEDIAKIAKINPGYSVLEKLVLRNKAVISLNPVEMVAKASITVFEAGNGKTQGWDFTSEIPSREQMSMIIQFIGNFRLELIEHLNSELEKTNKKEV